MVVNRRYLQTIKFVLLVPTVLSLSKTDLREQPG